MLIVIYILLIIVGLTQRKHNFLYAVLMAAFLAFCTYNGTKAADFENYEAVYKWIGAGNRYTDTGVGWYWICVLSNKVGLSYSALKAILIFISFVLLNTTINNFGIKRYKSIVLALYLLYPALSECVQIRFFVAECIIIYSLKWIKDYSFFNVVKYVLSVLIASSIHSACFFYFFFLLIPFFEKIKKVLAYIVVILSGVILFAKPFIIRIASIFLNYARIERYFNSLEGVGIYGIIAYLATLILFNYLLKAAYNTALIKKVNDIKSFDFVYKISQIIWLVLPFTFFDTNFFRLQRLMWFVLYLIFALLLEQKIYNIKFKNFSLKIKQIIPLVALMGFIFYICVFNFDVVSSLLKI